MNPIYPEIHCTYPNQAEHIQCVNNFINLVKTYGTDGYFDKLGNYAFGIYEFIEKYNENPLHKLKATHPAWDSMHALVFDDVQALIDLQNAVKTKNDVAMKQSMRSLVKNHTHDISHLHTLFAHQASLQACLDEELNNRKRTLDAVDGEIESPAVKRSLHNQPNTALETVSLFQIPQPVFVQCVLKQLDKQSLHNFFCVSKQARAFRLLVFVEIPHLKLFDSYLKSCLKNYNNNNSQSQQLTDVLTDDDLIHQAQERIKQLDLSQCQQIADDTFAPIVPLFTHLEDITLTGTNITNASLQRVRNLSKLKSIQLNKCNNISDIGLQSLATLTRLQHLDMAECRNITDTGLQHIATLTQLKHLNVAECQYPLITYTGNQRQITWFSNITDTGLQYITTLTQLQHLTIARCSKITDTGLQHIATLTQLQYLDIAQCSKITDTGLQHIATLTQLQQLELTACYKITNVGLSHLAALTQLRRLSLAGCFNITDTGLQHLTALQQLYMLSFILCPRITASGVENLLVLQRLNWVRINKEISDAAIQQLQRPQTHLRIINQREPTARWVYITHLTGSHV